MTVTLQLAIFLIFICLILSAFFSGAETTMIACNRIRMRHHAERGDKKASMVYRLLEKPEEFLSTTLVGNNLVVIAGSAIATYIVLNFIGPTDAEYLSTLIMAPLILIFGEILPKTFFYHRADSLAPWVAIPLRISSTLLAPIVFVTARPAAFLLRLLGKETTNIGSFISKEELRMLIGEGEREGSVEVREGDMIRRIFDFKGTLVREIMTPMEKAVCLNVNSSIEQAVSVVIHSGHSRIPVYRGERSNIIGLVRAFDLLDTKPNVPLESLMRPVYVVKETMVIEELLTSMQRTQQHLAIVVDEKDHPSGLVTLEDIIEEIVGEIEDEFDSAAYHRQR